MQSFEATVNLDIDQVIIKLAEIHQQLAEYQHKAMLNGKHKNYQAVNCNELDGLFAAKDYQEWAGKKIGEIKAAGLLTFSTNTRAVFAIRLLGGGHIQVRPLDSQTPDAVLFYDELIVMLKEWAKANQPAAAEAEQLAAAQEEITEMLQNKGEWNKADWQRLFDCYGRTAIRPDLQEIARMTGKTYGYIRRLHSEYHQNKR